MTTTRQETFRTRTHGGNLRKLAELSGRSPQEILDFSASINPLGPPEWLRSVISRNVEKLAHYPDPEARELVEAIADHLAVPHEEVLPGNGSAEIIHALPRLLGCRRAIIPIPSYVDYAASAEAAGLEVEYVPLSQANGFAIDWSDLASRIRGEEIVFLGQPNNPTGALFDAGLFRRMAAAHPQTRFVVDEAFADFIPGYESLAQHRPSNVVVLRSMTKFYAIPGLRLGFAVGDPALIQALRHQIPPWSVNVLAQAVGRAALADHSFAEETRRYVAGQRERLMNAFVEMSPVDWHGARTPRPGSQNPALWVYPSSANFLLVRVDHPHVDAHALADRLLKQDGIAIRTFDEATGLDHRFSRIAVRNATENDRLVAAMARVFGKVPPPRHVVRRAATLMFQGTSSNAGKSVLTTAMCRILLQDGLRVAPFKAQNMSLNSFVTRDGGEIGRAQALQSQACRLEPDVRMNPLLLKPSSETGCQVILRGKPLQNMDVREYDRYKPQAVEIVHDCFDQLLAEFDAVVLEGAGSPGEVNLKRQDLVNMAMARHAKAPVLLVGDIDRGGVYASFVGTMEVLAEWERSLLAGFVVNRFRGDASLLGAAHDYVLAHTGKPVLGVVPFLPDLNLPAEDSVDFKNGAVYGHRLHDKGCIDLALIDLPHISNFTDFDALRLEADVSIRIVRHPAELGRPDAVLIPGSKNTISDLAHLERVGLAAAIRELAGDPSGHVEIVGICGGYQMLGRTILDPHRIESSPNGSGERAQGLNLLNLETTLAPEKRLVRIQATHIASNLPVQGYEIHHGQTSIGDAKPLFSGPGGAVLGATRADGRVWGTYIHGLFDADAFRRYFIDRLRQRRGLPALKEGLTKYDLEPAIDRLADCVRQSLDMKAIYRLMGLA